MPADVVAAAAPVITVDIKKDWIDWLIIVFTVFAAVFVPAKFIYSQWIRDTSSRLYLGGFLANSPVLNVYQKAVSKLLDWLEVFFGANGSFRALNTSLLLAYVYPIFFFVLAYSFFDGAYQFSGMTLLPEKTEWQALFFPGLLLFTLIVFFIFRSIDKAEAWLEGIDQKGKRLLAQVGLAERIADQSYRLITALLSAGIFYYFVADQQIYVLLIGAVLGYLYGAFTVAIAGAVAGAVAVAVAGAAAYLGNYDMSIIFIFFYFVLPLINAVLDWVSWWVSRYFLERARDAKTVFVVIVDVFIDFVMAILFMLALCLLLPAGAMLVDMLFHGLVDTVGQNTGTAQTDWVDYAVAARDDPWGKGIMVTLMLVTTLIPTLLHIFLGLVAILIHGAFGQQLAAFLQRETFTNVHATVATAWVYGYGVLALGFMFGIYWALQAMFQMPIAHWLYSFTAYFYDLP